MRLFLASEGVNPETLKKLKDYIGGFKNKKIIYVPTAANAIGWEAWKTYGSFEVVKNSGCNVEARQLEECRDVKIDEFIGKPDIIWFAGGYSGYLMYWILKTKLDQYLMTLLKKDTIYVGSSAGSMIAGISLDVSEWFLGDPEPGAHFIPSLKLVDFDIYPHYEETLLPEIKKHYQGNKIYLLKDGEEIVVEDGKVILQGDERIISG